GHKPAYQARYCCPSWAYDGNDGTDRSHLTRHAETTKVIRKTEEQSRMAPCPRLILDVNSSPGLRPPLPHASVNQPYRLDPPSALSSRRASQLSPVIS